MQLKQLSSFAQNTILKMQKSLQEGMNQKTKDWNEKISHAKYRGTPGATINKIFTDQWVKMKQVQELEFQKRLQIAECLIKSQYSEDKILGIKIYDHLNKEIDIQYVDQTLSKLHIEEFIADYANSDWMSWLFYRPWTALSEQNSRYLATWAYSSNLWQRRASCVAFTKRAQFGDKTNFVGFMDMLYEIVTEVVSCSQKFNQTSVGMLIRDMSVSSEHRQRSMDWIKKHIDVMSRDCLNYAIKKLSLEQQKDILSLRGLQIKNGRVVGRDNLIFNKQIKTQNIKQDAEGV